MSLRVMIVEDEPLIALNLEDMLADAGHVVVGIAASHDEALKLARKTRPQVALMDMDLRGTKNGLETAAALGEAYRIVPLFITSRTDFLIRAMALPITPLGYLNKPFQRAKVLEALADFC